MKAASYFCVLFSSVMFLFTSCETNSEVNQPKSAIQLKSEVDTVLTLWHKSAAEANFNSYFSLMTDSAIFIGTDATENWTKQAFMEYSKPYFDKGKAWTFYAKTRTIFLNSDVSVAWFDEELVTQNLGPCRGSGVLVRENGSWKIAHYTLSLSVPNDLVRGVVKQIEDFEKKAN
jgi:hypothetical protein